MSSTIAATASIPAENNNISNLFSKAVGAIRDGAKQIGSLAFEFVKANPLISLVALDLAATGGIYTQAAIVGLVKVIAGSTTELGGSLWDYVF